MNGGYAIIPFEYLAYASNIVLSVLVSAQHDIFVCAGGDLNPDTITDSREDNSATATSGGRRTLELWWIETRGSTTLVCDSFRPR
jgi:hypothetical protein